VSFAVEVYRSGGGPAGQAAENDLIGAAAALRQEGQPISYLGRVALPGDEMVFYLFDADSQESIRELLRRVGVRPERIVDAEATTFGSPAA
jgi:hypothetical protein